jgi:nucleoside-diphosphate-sugar epimerase
MKKVIIFGGEGYIGLIVKNYLIKKNYHVKTFDNLIYDKHKNIKIRNDFIYGDICNKKNINSILNDFDHVVILSGLVGDPITKKYPKISKRINYYATKNLISVCAKKNLKKIIFISTCSNYGVSDNKVKIKENAKLKPLSLYAKDKVAIEKYILSLKGKTKSCFCILRFATAFGLSPRMRFDLTINEFVHTLFSGKKLKLYDVDTYRPYCHINDFARLIDVVFSSERKKINFETFNAGSTSNNYSKLSIFNLIRKKIKNSKFVILKESKDRRDYNVSFEKVKKVLNFKTKYSINYGINQIIDYLKKNKKIKTKNFGNYLINYNDKSS